MNKQQLAAKIWASANKMRSKIEANEYKDYILGFIFYKFLSDKELSFWKKNDVTGEELKEIIEENSDAVSFAQQNLGYFISYENLFSTWLDMGRNFTVSNVRDALSAFNRLLSDNHKKLFDKIFDTLHTGLSKLGTSTAEQSAAVRDLATLINDIPTDGRQDYDVLGFVYEYLISNFAANAGKKAGEFYTPHEVSVMMSEIIAHHLRDNEEIRIYDPTSGSGSLLINIGKSVARHIDNRDNIKYYAQELKQNTFNLTRMNLIMRGINPANIEVRCGDTLKDDWPYFDDSDPQGTYDPLYVDAVVSNPPYSQEWDPEYQESDPRYADFGLAPRGVADFAFLLHDLFHVKPSGIMTIVLPHGVLYRGGSEWQIRKALVEKNHIDAIIGLPEKVFFGTGISTIIMVLKRDTRKDDNILFVDASKGFRKDGKNNRLRERDILKIVDAVTLRKETPDFARLVSRETIRQNDYNLNISRYVDSSDRPEKYDIYATMFGGIPPTELQSLAAYWEAFPSLKQELFSENEQGYSSLSVKDIAAAIADNADVQDFARRYQSAFSDFGAFLEQTVISPMLSLNIPHTNTVITNELFHRLAPIPLVDGYQAYQFFSDDWKQIATDLEILQTEGFNAVHQIDEPEGDDPLRGHVLPFSLVQQELLPEQLKVIDGLRQQLNDIHDLYAQIIESLSPEECEKPYINDDNTKFVPAEVKKEWKRIYGKISCPEIDALRSYPSGKADKVRFIADHPEIDWGEETLESNGIYSKAAVNARIRAYADGYVFPEDSIEAKLKKVTANLEKEKEVIAQLSKAQTELFDKTLGIIRTIDEATAIELLRIKWLTPLLTSLSTMPQEVTNALTARIKQLVAKYATTYQDIANRIQSAEAKLFALIGELQGSPADTLGLKTFQQTLNAI